MGCDTTGRIKGYVSVQDIVDYIKQNYDKNVTHQVKKTIYGSIVEKCTEPYIINFHSEDNDNLYIYSGFIDFNDGEEDRQLFYDYSNVNVFENLEYYQELNLEDMVRTETTYISLGYFGNSVEIIKNILQHFDGGWIDENDCDDIPYEIIEPITNVKIGGIYKHRDDALFTDSHFILVDIAEDYKCVDIELGEETSNKAVQMFIGYGLNNDLFQKDDFWSVDMKEDLINNSDGYLGQISMPLLRGLKEISNKY